MSTEQQSKPPVVAEVEVQQQDSEFQRLLSKDSVGTFSSPERFKFAQRVGQLLVKSPMVPERFRGDNNLSSAVIAVDMGQRLGMSPLMVMQQIYDVHGKFGWSAQFIIAGINGSKRFETLRYDRKDLGKMPGSDKQNIQMVAWTTDRGVKLPEGVNTLDGARDKGVPVLEGPPVTIEMAHKEGWSTKNGSKWITMPEVMLRYRAAAFFGRLYCPELAMGLPTVEELEDTAAPPPIARPLFSSKTAQDEPKAAVVTSPTPAPAALVEAKPDAKPEDISRSRILDACAKKSVGQGALIQFLVDMGIVQPQVTSLELAPVDVVTMLDQQIDDMLERITEAGKEAK